MFPPSSDFFQFQRSNTEITMDLVAVMKSNLLLPGSNLLARLSESMPNASCGGSSSEVKCRDDAVALRLKQVAIAAILLSSLAGIGIPLVGKESRFLRTDGNLFVAAKAFAAGVILATGFVHMLPDGSSNLTDPCLPEYPWSEFPFSGVFSMGAALLTLLVDFVGTQLYQRKRRTKDDYAPLAPQADDEEDAQGHFGHVHAAGEEEASSRHVVVSQVLELGIVSHSVIIGLSLGVSSSTCTIRPLIAALSFHQFFEGFALGGCISQAQFKTLSTVIMACFFTLTTPAGIAIGIGVATSYNEDSARSLIIEGILDCVSAGILIYMALVDLIAADFMSKRMRCNVRLQIVCYCALFLGAGLMSLLAVWA